jgi:hypothetical protein
MYIVLCPFVLLLASCEPRALTAEDVFVQNDSTDSELSRILNEENPQGYRIYTLNDFLDAFMTEKGDFGNDTTPYRKRSTNGNGIYLFSVDTIPTDTIGIYIRGRVSTDDYAGNFYKAMVIQQAVSWSLPGTGDLQQQNLRISVDLGSSGGMFQIGQEILIRCNGLAVGRYANQPQLCVPSYNNNVYANSATEKVGWAPGRIPSGVFRNAVKLIGTPDQSKLIYDEDDLTNIRTKRGINFTKVNPTLADMDIVRKLDGRLVRIKDVHFSGQYYAQDASKLDCTYDDPDANENTNVFAPTTNNVGYPQSRILQNYSRSQSICCSNSEYCKYAYYFLPGAKADTINAVTECACFEGNVTGILGWYFDNAAYWDDVNIKNDGKEWSITPRGIPGIGIPDIEITKYVWKDVFGYKQSKDTTWVPEEFDPEFYRQYMNK